MHEALGPEPHERIAPEYVTEGRAELWSERARVLRLLHYLTRRQLADRYRGSALGILWSLLNPLLMLLIYGLVFSFIIRATVPGIPYGAYFLTGFLAWNFFNGACLNAGHSIANGGYLIRKAWFPRAVLPLSAVAANLVNYLIALPLLLVFNAIVGVLPGWGMLWFPLALLLLLVFSTGLALLVATASAYFRDLIELLQILLMAWFFATPILYPMSMVLGSEKMQGLLLLLYRLNPMQGIIRFVQASLLGQAIPWPDVAWSAAMALLLLLAGALGFRRHADRFTNAVQ